VFPDWGVETQSRRSFPRSTIPSQGIGAVALISEGMAPNPQMAPIPQAGQDEGGAMAMGSGRVTYPESYITKYTTYTEKGSNSSERGAMAMGSGSGSESMSRRMFVPRSRPLRTRRCVPLNFRILVNSVIYDSE
jgi:hypothetical protein